MAKWDTTSEVVSQMAITPAGFLSRWDTTSEVVSHFGGSLPLRKLAGPILKKRDGELGFRPAFLREMGYTVTHACKRAESPWMKDGDSNGCTNTRACA